MFCRKEWSPFTLPILDPVLLENLLKGRLRTSYPAAGFDLFVGLL